MRRTFKKRRTNFRRRNRPFRRTRRLRLRRGTSRPSRKVFRGLGQPDELFIKASFVTEADVDLPSNTAVTTLTLKLNSLFESNPAVATEYVMGISQYANFYKKAMVTASKITATFSVRAPVIPPPIATGVSSYGWWAILPTTTVNPTNIEDPLEQKYHKSQFYGNANSNRAVQKIKHFMTPKKLFGNPIGTQPTQYSSPIDPTQAGGAQADPTQVAYWQLYFNNYEVLNTLAPTTLGVVKVKVTYFIKLYSRRELSDD